MTPAARERAAVVAWLRHNATTPQELEAARVFERGLHLTKLKPPRGGR